MSTANDLRFFPPSNHISWCSIAFFKLCSIMWSTEWVIVAHWLCSDTQRWDKLPHCKHLSSLICDWQQWIVRCTFLYLSLWNWEKLEAVAISTRLPVKQVLFFTAALLIVNRFDLGGSHSQQNCYKIVLSLCRLGLFPSSQCAVLGTVQNCDKCWCHLMDTESSLHS